MSVTASDGVLVLSDFFNDTVKALHLSTGTITRLFHESTPGWYLTNALLHGDASGDLRLLVAESKNSSQKRMVVSEREQPSGLYTHTYHIPFIDDEETVSLFATVLI